MTRSPPPSRSLSAFERLRVELIIHILCFLASAKDLVRARRSCIRLQEVIDDVGNAAEIISVMRDRKVSRIQAFIFKHITFGQGKLFHHALADIFINRGIWPQPIDRQSELESVSAIWADNQPASIAAFAGSARWTTGQNHARRMATCNLELHLQHYAPDFVDAHTETMNRSAFINNMVQADYGFGAQYFATVFDDITAKAPKRQEVPGSLLLAPLYYLTSTS